MGRKYRKKRKNHVKQKSTISHTPDKGTYVQRTHKDTLFRFIFRDKEKLLQLYNALNDSEYEDIDQLTVTTVENILYLGYKNDISFLLDQNMCLYEHQGSWNPNMPLRGILYFARIYQGYIEKKGYNLYGSKQLFLPVPRYVVFYNGVDERPEREILKLSDSFMDPVYSADIYAEPALECTALVLNINYGKNQKLLEKCKTLMDYSKFVFGIREKMANGFSAEEAVDQTVDECIKNDILADVLRAHRKEVVTMFLEEYDQELHYKTIREEAFEDGFNDGKSKLNLLAQRMITDGRAEEFLKSTKDLEYQKKLLKEYEI